MAQQNERGLRDLKGGLFAMNGCPPKRVRTSIVVVNYNGKSFLKNCIDSLTASEASQEEIIIVDNASIDESCAYIRKEFPHVKLLALDKNYGFAEANNRGVQSASGEYVIFLNNDTAVTPGWLTGLVNVMEADREIGVAGSKILLMHEPGKINSAGGAITFSGGGYDIGFMDNDSERYNIPGVRGCVCGAAMMVRRDEFLDFGGFDGNYFMYFEDVDLCWRYWLFGKKVVYVPASVVYHKFGGTSGKIRHAPLRVFYGTRNALLNIIKNYEARSIPFPLFFSFLHHLLKTLYFLLRLEGNLSMLMIKAYISFFRLIPEANTRRKEIQRRRKVSDEYLFDNSLIVSFAVVFKEFRRLFRI